MHSRQASVLLTVGTMAVEAASCASLNSCHLCCLRTSSSVSPCISWSSTGCASGSSSSSMASHLMGPLRLRLRPRLPWPWEVPANALPPSLLQGQRQWQCKLRLLVATFHGAARCPPVPCMFMKFLYSAQADLEEGVVALQIAAALAAGVACDVAQLLLHGWGTCVVSPGIWGQWRSV